MKPLPDTCGQAKDLSQKLRGGWDSFEKSQCVVALSFPFGDGKEVGTHSCFKPNM